MNALPKKKYNSQKKKAKIKSNNVQTNNLNKLSLNSGLKQKSKC